MGKIVFIVMLSLVTVVLTKHIHHPHLTRNEDTADPETIQIDEVPIEAISHMKNNFVPLNNMFIFRSYKACEDGYKRDFFGVCREVWE